METLFPDNPARRLASKKGTEGRTGVKKANESDVSDLTLSGADNRLKRVMWRTRTRLYAMQIITMRYI